MPRCQDYLLATLAKLIPRSVQPILGRCFEKGTLPFTLSSYFKDPPHLVTKIALSVLLYPLTGERVASLFLLQTNNIELGDEGAVMQEEHPPETHESAELLDTDGDIDDDEHQEVQADSTELLVTAAPRWELSIFTARYFDSSSPDPESASPAA